MISHFLYFLIINLAVIFIGYHFIRLKLIWQSWALMIGSVLLVNLICLNDSPIFKITLFGLTIFSCMKVVTNSISYSNKEFKLSLIQWTLFSIVWAGMRAEGFENMGSKPLPKAWAMIRFGIIRLIIGISFLILAHRLVVLDMDKGFQYFIVSVVLFLGFGFIIHFGLLSINAGLWRLLGVRTYFLFNAPWKSVSLTEYWSKRWNIAFIEMIAITIVRPLKTKIGYEAAAFSGFVFSGLLHELVFSVPVNSGYGLPFLYLTLHGLLVSIERLLIRHKIMILTNKVIGGIWTMFWMLAPINLLFHERFIKEIIWAGAGITH